MMIRNLFTVLGVLLTVNACDNSPLADMSDAELKSKAMSCRANKNPSRTAAIICENVERECKIRRDKGRRVC